MRWTMHLSIVWIVACGGSDPRPDPAQCDPPVWDEQAVRRAQPSPDGEGWCCHSALGFPSEGTYLGGFASDPCECAGRFSVDAPTCVYEPYVDDHGCDAFSTRWSACGTPDAGSPEDAASGCDGCGP